MIDPKLLEILMCPVCKVKVVLQQEHIVCTKCARAYPIREGIPVMLPEEASKPRSNERDDPES